MGILDKIFGDANKKAIEEIQPIVKEINSLEKDLSILKNKELQTKSLALKEKVRKNNDEKILDKFLPEAFALVREASKRILGQRHYDVQLIGGIVLHRGQIAEMKTGEGKTLVATLPLYLNALTGRGAQLITVNDYLSRVGAGWMAPVYHFLGLSVSVIVHDAAFIYDPEYVDDSQYDDRLKHFRLISRKEAYNCDIVYGTNNEFGFDYLRDNMAPGLEYQVQRELNYVIVDEIDSILIDEARTPLIISAPAEESTDKYFKFAQYVRQLKENEDYNIDEKMRAATLTESGIAKMERMLGVDNIYTAGGISDVHHIEQALKAHTLFKKDRDYVVKDGEIIIVDEFTGRLMHGRRYSEGLHQAIEAKENVKIQRESQTLATITFQNYFRMYKKLSGMTGTAATEAEEFSKIYNLDTVVIPTHKPNIRIDLNDLVYRSEAGKFKAVIEDVKKRHQKGQPILIGTISIEKNEILSTLMEQQGLKVQVLNAKNHDKEARIIANAGKIGAITLATNMAGRGVDIMLGGHEPAKNTPEHQEWQKEHEKVLALGGLHVIGTERHESRRIDNQLRGRAGRMGDKGSSQFFVSMDDDLMRIFGGDRMKRLMATLRVPEEMPIENKMISKSIESAQRKVEGNNFDIRKHLVEYDDVLNKHREAIYRRRRNILELAYEEKNDSSDTKELQFIPKKEKEENREPWQGKSLSEIILLLVEAEVEHVVSTHTAAENTKDWNIKEIKEVTTTIFPVDKDFDKNVNSFIEGSEKLDKAKARTKIIEYILKLAYDKYLEIKKTAIDNNVLWSELEKSVLIRSIDTLWVEHLEAMASMRQGIGLRGYGQRDPLIEYKREAFYLYNELNSLIQKEVVYSIYKLGAMANDEAARIEAPNLVQRAKNYIAPAKTMSAGQSSFASLAAEKKDNKTAAQNGTVEQALTKTKLRDKDGKKIGRNDPCPCGSGKKYKKCCGK